MTLEHLLEARSVAIVGASPRPDSLGNRVVVEVARSPRPPALRLVNPAHAGREIEGMRVLASLDDVPGPVDLVLIAVGDASLESVLTAAAARGDRSAVVFGSAVDPVSPADSRAFRARLAAVATSAGMELCGGGCMGFVSRDLRAIGYLERFPLPTGPIALVTCSGSAFSALLRTERPFGFSLAVSSGQELVTTTADYVDYALSLPATEVVALVIESLRSPGRLRAALARAATAGVPVVALAVGATRAGRVMAEAHSGALAGADGAFEALFDAHGVLRVHDLAEMCDTIELLLGRRRPPRRPPRPAPQLAAGAPSAMPERGIAAVFDSGGERALAADMAADLGVTWAPIGPDTTKRLRELLDPGLEPGNPLDVWGRGASTEELMTGSLLALADDDAVDAVAFAVDLVPELDGDESYRDAILGAWAKSDRPMCVLSHVPSAVDRAGAARIRAAGIPVLEGTRTGLLALRHLCELRDFAERAAVSPDAIDPGRAERARDLDGEDLLRAYGIASPRTIAAGARDAAMHAAVEIGFPVVMKTAEAIAHKTEAGGVILGVESAQAAGEAYDRLARIGPHVSVSRTAPPGVELSLGIVSDPQLGPLLVLGAGGVLVELLADRVVALPPLDRGGATRLIGRLRVAPLLEGFRGGTPADTGALADAIVAMSRLAVEVGDGLDALEINPLSCGPAGVLALDVLVERRGASSDQTPRD